MGGRGRWLSHEGGGRDGRGRSHHSMQQRLSVRWSGVHPSILPFLPPPCGRGASASVSFIPSFLCGLPPSPHRRRRRRRRRRPTSTLSKQGVCPSVRPSLARAPPLLSVLRPPSGEEDRFYKWRNESVSVSVLLPKRARALLPTACSRHPCRRGCGRLRSTVAAAVQRRGPCYISRDGQPNLGLPILPSRVGVGRT